MANISSYPLITPKSGDLLIGSETYDANAASPVVGNPTRSFTVSGLGATISPIIADGTINKIAMFTSANKVGDSTISSTSGDITIAQSLTVGDSLIVTQDGSFGNDLFVGNDFTVTGDTVLNTVRITSTLADTSSSVGTPGQVLSSTATGTAWINHETQVFSSLTTTGTSGAATLVGGVLNVPQYASSALPYTSLFVKLTQSGNNNPTYSVLSNGTGISLTGIGYSTGYTTLFMASGTYPADGEAMIVTGGYRSGRSSNPTMTGFHDGQTIKIITGYYEFNGTAEATFVKDDFGFGGTQSTIIEIRVFN